MTPDPPKPGYDLQVRIKGTVQDTLKEGAWVDVLVKLGLIKLQQIRYDLKEEFSAGRLTSSPQSELPFAPGDIELIYTLPLARETPRAKFTVAC